MSQELITVFALLFCFQLKHFLADYPLQNFYMLGKFKRTDWFEPLICHAAVHGLLTLIVVYVFTINFWLAVIISIADITIHAVVDRIKAHPDLGGRWDNTKPQFWWALGLDQMAHHLTHYVFIYIIVSQGV